MDKHARIFVAGHRGLVGSAVVRRLEAEGYSNLILRTRAEVDLANQAATFAFFDGERPEYVVLAAAKVGGILANDTYPADFLYENLVLEANIFEGARRAGATKLLFLGSSCIYPKHAPQPMKEEHLLTGPLEPTNQWYAIAKIAGIKLAEAYRRQHGMNCISAMPTNLYGPGDDFDLATSHVLPALIRKFHEAKVSKASEVVIWGTGTPRREFLHVDDLADAACFLLKGYDEPGFVNVGVGHDISIGELAALVQRVVGYDGALRYDLTKPDGTPRKLLDVSRMSALGWSAKIDLEAGIRATYEWFCANQAQRLWPEQTG
jgi:GDP-L-fucose synthase